VVASSGGGRAGYRLLKPVLAACRRLQGRRGLRLALFTGPFMAEAEFDDLQAEAGEDLVVQRFTPRFLDYLSAADLSISLAGYNTCMNLLATGVPALVLPYARQREQPLRVERLKPYLPLTVLSEEDLAPERLAPVIESGLQLKPRLGPPPVNLAGAARRPAVWKIGRTAVRLRLDGASPPRPGPSVDVGIEVAGKGLFQESLSFTRNSACDIQFLPACMGARSIGADSNGRRALPGRMPGRR